MILVIVWILLGWTGWFAYFQHWEMYSRSSYWTIADVCVSWSMTIAFGALLGPVAWLLFVFRKKL